MALVDLHPGAAETEPIAVHEAFAKPLRNIPHGQLLGHLVVQKVTRTGRKMGSPRLLIICPDALFMLTLSAGRVRRVLPVADIVKGRVKSLGGGREEVVLVAGPGSSDPTMHVQFTPFDPRQRPTLDGAGLVKMISKLRERKGLPPTELDNVRHGESAAAGVDKSLPKQYRSPASRLKDSRRGSAASLSFLSPRTSGSDYEVRVKRDGNEPLGLLLEGSTMSVSKVEPDKAAARSGVPAAVVGRQLATVDGRAVQDMDTLAAELQKPGDKLLTFKPAPKAREAANPGRERTLRLNRAFPQEALGLSFDNSLVLQGCGGGAAARSKEASVFIGMRLVRVCEQPISSPREIRTCAGDSLAVDLCFVPARASLGESSLGAVDEKGVTTLHLDRGIGEPLGLQFRRKLGGERGLDLEMVEAHGAATRCGRARDCVGMRLVSVNGVPTDDQMGLSRLLADCGAHVTLKFRPGDADEAESLRSSSTSGQIGQSLRRQPSAASTVISVQAQDGAEQPPPILLRSSLAETGRNTCRRRKRATIVDVTSHLPGHAQCTICGGALCEHERGVPSSGASYCSTCGRMLDGGQTCGSDSPGLQRTLSQVGRSWSPRTLVRAAAASPSPPQDGVPDELETFSSALSGSKCRDVCLQVQTVTEPLAPASSRRVLVDGCCQTDTHPPSPRLCPCGQDCDGWRLASALGVAWSQQVAGHRRAEAEVWAEPATIFPGRRPARGADTEVYRRVAL